MTFLKFMMIKKHLFVILLLVLTSSYSIAQIRVIDSKTRLGIPQVHLISSDGILLSVSDVEGILDIKSDFIAHYERDVIEISHVSYHKQKMILADLIAKGSIALTEKKFLLDDVEISDNRDNRDVLVLKGYFRSYQIDNNIPKSYADGIVEYYISSSKGLKLRILDCRYYRNKNTYHAALKDKKNFSTTGDRASPPYIYKKTILKKKPDNYYPIIKNSLDSTSNTIIIDDKTMLIMDSNKVTVSRNKVTPETSYSRSFLNIKFEFEHQSLTEVYSLDNGYWNDKSYLTKHLTYLKQFIGHKKSNKPPVKVESIGEFYVIEIKYMSNLEFKRTNTISFFGPARTNYKTQFWKDLEGYGINEPPSFIQSLFGNTLVAY